MSIPKCVLGVAWTSALIAITISTAMFSLFDIGSVIEPIGIDSQQGNPVLKSFVFMSILIWLLLWSSVLLNCFYTSLRNSNCGSCKPNDSDSSSDNSSSQNTAA